jgi:glycosyltransferase involved in cell wall biosynthesis
MNKGRYNIAHILPWPSVGGVEHATLRIAQAVEGEQFRNYIFYLKSAPVVGEFFTAAGFESTPFEAIQPSYRRPKNFLQASFELSREFKKRDINVVHCSDVLAGHFTAIAGWISRVPVICHIRNRLESISSRDKSFLYPINKYIFVSKNTWQTFPVKVPTKRGLVIYDGIDINERLDDEVKRSVREEFNIPEGVKLVGMAARIAPQKDYETLAKAAARVVEVYPNVRFLVVGDNSKTEEYREHFKKVKEWLNKYNVTSHFIFTGYRSDVLRVISGMDIFVLSTHLEGLPLVILEAMSQAVPVLATAVDGIPEIVIEGETGLLHPHKDDKRLAENLLRLLKDEAYASQLGLAGREFIKREFSRERFSNNMLNLYRDILGLKKSL